MTTQHYLRLSVEDWRDPVLRIEAVRVQERAGSRGRPELNGQGRRCHRPHPGKEAKRHQVEATRERFERAGVQP